MKEETGSEKRVGKTEYEHDLCGGSGERGLGGTRSYDHNALTRCRAGRFA